MKVDFCTSDSYKTWVIFTARCYAERSIATANRLSVRLSVTLRYADFWPVT